jgi:hypothetical protein
MKPPKKSGIQNIEYNERATIYERKPSSRGTNNPSDFFLFPWRILQKEK